MLTGTERPREAPEILVYFNRIDGFASSDELDDLRAVVEFRRSISNEVLVDEYDTTAELLSLARKHLIIAVRRWKARAAGRRAEAANYDDDPHLKQPGAPAELADEPATSRST
jgi:hypothetical protein